jgi:hypothetical protein
MIVTYDMTIAREVHRDRIRQAVSEQLVGNTNDYLDALARGEDTTAVAQRRIELEEAPDDPAIDSAATIDDLKAVWDTNLLGPSPYPDPQ